MCRKVCFTVLISGRECFIFLPSLCTGAFCGGFLCPKPTVPGRRKVIPEVQEEVLPPAIPGGSENIDGTENINLGTFIRAGISGMSRL